MEDLDLLFGSYIKHYDCSCSDFIIMGMPVDNTPYASCMKVVINGVLINPYNPNTFEDLDNEIYKANIEYIKPYFTGVNLKVDNWTRTQYSYRIDLCDTVRLTGKASKSYKMYNLKNNIVLSFAHGDLVDYLGKTYTFIKWAYSNSRLIYAIQDIKSKKILLVDYSEVTTAPTTEYFVKYTKTVYKESSATCVEYSVDMFATTYNNQIVYYIDGEILSGVDCDKLVENKDYSQELDNAIIIQGKAKRMVKNKQQEFKRIVNNMLSHSEDNALFFSSVLQNSKQSFLRTADDEYIKATSDVHRLVIMKKAVLLHHPITAEG